MRGGIALIAGVLLAAAVCGQVAAVTRPQAAQRETTYGQVYLMRGLMGQVLSTGLDQLAARLAKRGIHAPVYSHNSYGTLADQAIARWRAGNRGPIVIIGHSLGANAAIDMAKELQTSHIPVSLVVSYGPNGDLQVPANVSSVVNYYQSKSFSSSRVVPGPGFHGTLSNIDLEKNAEINHVNMVQVDRLQVQVISRVTSLVGAHGPAHAFNATAPAASSGVSSSANPAPSAASRAN